MRELLFKAEARERLGIGIDALADAVKVTLGPKGRNVIIRRAFGNPIISKDGVTVAKEVEVSDPVANTGVLLVREVASQTADNVGDGTTTATVIAQALVKAGMKSVSSGSNPMSLKRGMDKALAEIVKELTYQSVIIGDSPEMVRQVATISANNDPILGELIANTILSIGKDGSLTIEESSGYDTYVEKVVGTKFDKGYLSPYFVTNRDSMLTEYSNPYILLYDGKITDIQDIASLLEEILASKRPLLIIAEDIETPVLTLLVTNKLNSGLKVVAVKSPEFGERRKDTLEDIALITGGTLISPSLGHSLSNVELSDLGQAQDITISRSSTTILEGSGDKETIKARVDTLRERSKTAEDYDKRKLNERISKLSEGVAVLHVGGYTEVEMRERKDRVEDALAATRAALDGGIVTGGGVALVRTIKSIESMKGLNEDETIGIQIVRKALESPLRTIAENAGREGSVVLEKVLRSRGDMGYNALTDKFEDLKKAGVIDPTKVTRVALENAVSIAGMILTTECVITDTSINTQE